METNEFKEISEEDLYHISKKYAYFSEGGLLHYFTYDFYILDEIIFEGFNDIPKYFSKHGGGLGDKSFNAALKRCLVDLLNENNITLVNLYITSEKSNTFELIRNNGYNLKIDMVTFSELWKFYQRIYHTNRNKNDKILSRFIMEKFPDNLKNYEDKEYLKPYLFSAIKVESSSELSSKELDEMERFYTKVVEKNKTNKKFLISNFLNIEKLNFEQIITEFKGNLDKEKSLSETDWQRFFEQNIFLFDSRYVDFLPKFSLKSGKGSEPDFFVYDIYGTIDIFEIKKPETRLLSHDKSHDNYYWCSEVSKAIAQLEKYLFLAMQNRLEIERNMKRKMEK